MKKLGFNPYLPSWEYIPDAEPHVFGDRVYIYGSHDWFNGYEYCPGDYMGYSAPVTDLTDWRCEGVIYGRTDDPLNKSGEGCLYAPDVTQGPDGRYYLYYVLNNRDIVSVAVCDTPAGRYSFLGYVHYKDGTILGEKEGDEPQFDPGVLTEGNLTYMYTGFAPGMMPGRSGAQCTVLGPDMLTIEEAPVIIAPSPKFSQGTGFEGHEFFEASSIRKFNDTYYFVYSSCLNHEMCYATSKYPNKDFKYGGVIVSNIDAYLGGWKQPEQVMGYRDNNHGGMECINGKYYMFYHRHTNNYGFSRQTCFEPIEILPDGSIPQVEMSSSGPNGGPLPGSGTYPAYIACNVYRYLEEEKRMTMPGMRRNPGYPYITQVGRDNDENMQYIENIQDGAIIGFKYFECKNSVITSLQLRGFGRTGCKLEVALTPYGEPVGTIDLPAEHTFENCWGTYKANVALPDGVNAIYFRLNGIGKLSFNSFTLEQK